MEEDPPIHVEFKDSDADYPAVNQTDIISDTLSSSYIWCSKKDDGVRALSLTFHLLDIALPSKSAKAQAILADSVCTMTEAEMSDCDAVVDLTMKSVTTGGIAHIGINEDWDLWVINKDGKLQYDFEANNDSATRKDLHLMAR